MSETLFVILRNQHSRSKGIPE